MACSGGACSNRLQRSEIEKWTDDIGQLMADTKGRNLFIKFLRERELHDALTNIHFCSKCEEVINRMENDQNLRLSTYAPALRRIVQIADVAIDFYENEMNVLRSILVEDNPEKVCEILKTAKARTLALLDDEHREFSNHLIKGFFDPCR